MRIHRFYTGDTVELKHDLWIHDADLVHQWNRVLRMQPGQELVLFDGQGNDRLYKLDKITKRDAHLLHVTDFDPQTPRQKVYLLWSLLKKDKNEWILQKGTELGVSHFLPLLADRSEKTGFNTERANKIVIEAAEQCGRSDIPTVRDPLHIETAIEELKEKMPLFICEQGENELDKAAIESAGVLIGPEGGWSDAEKQLFKELELPHLNLHSFTLRAETAAIAASAKLLQ